MAVVKQPIEFKRSPSKWLDLESACTFLKDEYSKTVNVNELLYAGSQGDLNIFALLPQGQHTATISVCAGWDDGSGDIELKIEYIELDHDQIGEIVKYYPAENCYQIQIGNSALTTHKLLRISTWDLHDLFSGSKAKSGRPAKLSDAQIKEIKKIHKDQPTLTASEIANAYNVSDSTIKNKWN
ncbi:MAG: hypothetical protein RL565_1449 [Pseudomonadota bacterium]|jgi:hypothetical protein